MKISDKGLSIIQEFEGCRLKAYICPAGVLTIGYGHTGKDVKSGMSITKSQAIDLLRKDVAKFEKQVMKYNSTYKWNQNQFDALVSFAFNIGSIDQLTNNGKRSIAEISAKIPAYNKANGKALAGLTRRRAAEKKLFDTAVKKETKKSSSKTTKTNKKETTISVSATGTADYFKKDLAGTYTTTANLNMRDDAGVSNKSLVVVPKGTKVQCYGYYSLSKGVNWLLVQATIKGVPYTGFCSKSYLKK